MKINYTFPVESIQGAFGEGEGLCFFKWRGLPVARKNAVPANPQSASQVAIRNILTQCAQAYQSVTEAEKVAWDELCASYPEIINGKEIILPANGMYTRVNSFRLIDSQSVSDTAPTVKPSFVATSFESVAYNSGTGHLTFELNHSLTSISSQKWVLYMTPALPSAIAQIKQKDFRLIAGVNNSSIIAASGDPQSVDIASPFYTSLTNGCYIGLKAIPLGDDYMPGTEYFEKVQVTVS